MVPLTSIAHEVKQECLRLGIRAVVGSQVISVQSHTTVHLVDIQHYYILKLYNRVVTKCEITYRVFLTPPPLKSLSVGW